MLLHLYRCGRHPICTVASYALDQAPMQVPVRHLPQVCHGVYDRPVAGSAQRLCNVQAEPQLGYSEGGIVLRGVGVVCEWWWVGGSVLGGGLEGGPALVREACPRIG